MKQLLAAEGIQLTKSLGQNFLHDGNQLRRIVAAAELSKTDQVLEIGPGLGPLTCLLVQEAGYVLAIEKDARLARLLNNSLGAPDNEAGRCARFHLVQDDALVYLRRQPANWADWKLVSNLPYSVASPILVELAQARSGPARMVATLQLEVARRLMASAGEADYGVLTLLMKLDYQPVEWFKIPATCFFPEPEVDSACVVLARRPKPLLSFEQRATFTKLVKCSFSQRRKMMAKLLKAQWPAANIESAFADAELSTQARAEDVGLEQFVLLTKKLHE
ncbi:MAG TPA: 16S rRNA (adenine(1518)-N(6)/adenine(1519)-N(6))-dimethyltransferase RsmA [Verrucomicrobiae bacterium]|nr:16S rRNA (adenine(1518)-N(6)/adenine(1519)-N(6))-dimethyltransferase RsmA [Verrucomicrobiae bacterium]